MGLDYGECCEGFVLGHHWAGRLNRASEIEFVC